MIKYLPKNDKQLRLGQSLIGILVAMAVFSILAQAIFTVVGASFNFVSFNRARITARFLAEQKIELIRNLPYDDVGTDGGIPSGSLAQQETVTSNGLNYTIKTTIIYIDDPFDDTVPSDLLGTDYKRVRVEISWKGLAGSRTSPIVLLTDVAPKGIETTVGGGTLSILVFDASGNPVPQADVQITAATTSPPVNLTLQTGSNGRVILPGAPTCISCYQVTVSKSGYSSERTYSTTEVANPNKPHLTIIQGQLTEVSFAIDNVSSLNIATKKGREDSFEALGNVNLHIRGEKTIGTDTSSQPVYKYEDDISTNSGGNLTINNLEWDNYLLSLPSGSSYDVSGSNPMRPVVIIPDVSVQNLLALSTRTTNNLLISFVDSASSPIASVSATLSDGAGYNLAKFAGDTGDPDLGQVFYSNLSVKSYALSASASGFLNYSGNINVNGITNEKVILTPE